MTELYTEPNKHARQGRFVPDQDGQGVHVYGYNSYHVTRNTIEPDDYSALIQKSNIIRKHISHLDGKTFLDLGCSTGYYSILALQAGAMKVTAIDMDEGQLDILAYVAEWFKWGNLETHAMNVIDWTGKCDVVLALALLHWIYSCTALIGSIDKAVGRLASLANETLYLEWVDLSDESMQWFKHTEYNREAQTEAYTENNFQSAIRRHFYSVQLIGTVNKTRQIYRCSKR